MKRFLKHIILFLLLAGAPFYVSFFAYTIGIKPYCSGDLDYLAMIPFAKGYVHQDLAYTKPIVNCDYDAVPTDSSILIIGDSFSQDEDGTVSTYAAYFSDLMNESVYNLKADWQRNPVYRFVYLAKQGRLPKTVIVENVERNLIDNFIGVDYACSAEDVWEMHIKNTTPKDTKKQNIFEESQEYLRKRWIKPDTTTVRHCSLTCDLFSCIGKESDLYFYGDDLRFGKLQKTQIQLIAAMDSLIEFADEHDVKLYILIAADKFDTYYPYIVDRHYPYPYLLDSIVSERYPRQIVSSRDTLRNLLENGVKDVYWCNNTHWGPIGSKAVAEKLKNELAK